MSATKRDANQLAQWGSMEAASDNVAQHNQSADNGHGSNSVGDRPLLSNEDSINISNVTSELIPMVDIGASIVQDSPELASAVDALANVAPKLAFPALQEIQNILNNYFVPSVKAMVAGMQQLIDYSKLIPPITEQLNSAFKTLKQLIKEFNWDGYRSAFHKWGSFGWIIPDNMPLTDISQVPLDLKEADRRCLQFYDRETLNDLFVRLEQNIRKKRDMTEAILLFRTRHYKPCAMMLCSLIEGELIALGNRKNVVLLRKGRQSGKSTLSAFKDCDLPSEGFTALMLENFLAAWDYFFHGGKDFNREIEGELNRNFLMHGMMYKPVRRKTCIKLFSLLERITTILPKLASSGFLEQHA